MALVAFAASDLALSGPGRGTRVLAFAALAVLAAKIGAEMATGASMLPWSLPAGVFLAAKTHLAGAVAGALLALGGHLLPRSQPSV